MRLSNLIACRQCVHLLPSKAPTPCPGRRPRTRTSPRTPLTPPPAEVFYHTPPDVGQIIGLCTARMAANAASCMSPSRLACQAQLLKLLNPVVLKYRAKHAHHEGHGRVQHRRRWVKLPQVQAGLGSHELGITMTGM
eukprot:540559-Rhodomonas_salina.2